jgi:hypothetical protein
MMLSVPGMGGTAVGADAVGNELGCLLGDSEGLSDGDVLGLAEGTVDDDALDDELGCSLGNPEGWEIEAMLSVPGMGGTAVAWC